MSSFQFKQFSIEQDLCAMKVGTDGVLLGAWTSVKGTNTCLDIGTGTGLLALMLAQRTTPTRCDITAIEIDADAALQASANIAASPWSSQIRLHHTALQNFQCSLSYDLIVSNPPFYNATLKPSDEARAVARHKDSLPVSEITHFAQIHLSQSGRLALIYPTAYDSEVMTAAVLSGLQPVRICDVCTKEGKPAKRRMIELMRTADPHPQLQLERLSIRDACGQYTEQYRALTSSFYLAFN